MFAVFRSGGKQHKVGAGDIVVLEKLTGTAGDQIAFDEVLAVGDDKSQSVGAPLVSGATVAGTIVEQGRGEKIIVFKKKRRKNYRRRAGHRQQITVVRIDEILTDGKKPSPVAKPKAAAKPKADAQPKTEAKTEAKKPAAKKPAAKKAAAKKPAAKKPAAMKPAAKKPAAKKKLAAKGAKEKK